MTLRNWGPFRGEHTLALDEGLHVVVAAHDGDASQSNGAGKSTVLLAIPFALFGRVPGSAADFVSEGEVELEVRLELSDGTIVRRGWNEKGGWVDVSGVEDARRRDADAELAERIGFGAADFLSTCFLGQGETGVLLAGGAATRDALAAWVVPDLWPTLERKVKRLEAESTAEVQRLRGRLAATEPTDVEPLREELARLEAIPLKRADAKREQAARGWLRWQQLACAIVKAREDLPAPPLGEVAEDLPALEERLGEERAQHAEHTRQARELGKLARGEFAGPCPVDAVECPRADEIRAGCAQHAEQLQAALWHAQSIEMEIGALKERIADGRAKAGARERQLDALARLESERERLPLGVYRRPDDTAARETAARIGELRARIERASQDAQERARSAERLRATEGRLLGLRWLLRACGREGVPAMLADEAAEVVAAEASAILAAAGSGLRLGFRVRRELKKPASVCSCGVAFQPRERKCSACGEVRGRELDLDMQPVLRGETERAWLSSGQRAMAAVALRLGAAAWRRRLFGAAWGTLVLDEAEGPLDRANELAIRQIARQGARTAGFEQVFLVSHRAAQLAGERMIRVERRDGWSKLC